jgi:hypothetical protein
VSNRETVASPSRSSPPQCSCCCCQVLLGEVVVIARFAHSLQRGVCPCRSPKSRSRWRQDRSHLKWQRNTRVGCQWQWQMRHCASWDGEGVLCVGDWGQGGTKGGVRVTGGSIGEKIPVQVRGIGRGEEGSPVVLQKGARRRPRSGGTAREHRKE